MAATFTCDGCGANVSSPKQVGHVVRRDYCAECAKNAEAFLAAEEDQRALFQERFVENRKQLINLHSNAGKFKLPDVA